MSVSERVAIAGVTGYIGGRLAPRLLEHGYAIRCLVRSPAKLQNRSWVTDPNVQIRQADLADEASLTRDLEGCEAAFYLVHSMMSAGRITPSTIINWLRHSHVPLRMPESNESSILVDWARPARI